MKDAQMIKAESLALMDECKKDFEPVARLISSTTMLASCLAGMLDRPSLHADAIKSWSLLCKNRNTYKHIEDAGIKALTTMYNQAVDARHKRNESHAQSSTFFAFTLRS